MSSKKCSRRKARDGLNSSSRAYQVRGAECERRDAPAQPQKTRPCGWSSVSRQIRPAVAVSGSPMRESAVDWHSFFVGIHLVVDGIPARPRRLELLSMSLAAR